MNTLHLPRKDAQKTRAAGANMKTPAPNAPVTGAADVDELLVMLTYARAHGSDGEALFVERFILPLPGITGIDNWAWRVVVPRADGTPADTLFSSHVDTVHPDSANPRQGVDYDANLGVACPAGPHVLGADDAAGVWIMRQMIAAGVPGTYVFHRCEERGGQGSEHLALKHGEWLEGFARAVAFDRRGTADVITHQGWGRCCSNKFAKALADALNEESLNYAPSDGGVFTDTANYTELIAECTNLSVGYAHEHTEREMIDVEHLCALRDACLKVQWDELPTQRRPGEDDSGRFNTSLSFAFESDFGTRAAYSVADLYDMNGDDLHEFVEHNPADAASLMWELLWGEDA